MTFKRLIDTYRTFKGQEEAIGGNQATAIKKPMVLQGGSKKDWDPIGRNIRKVPNVSSFKVSARIIDQFLMKFGLLRKTGGTITSTAYKNRDINRYIEHQLIRMAKADEITYGRIATALMRRSKCFYIIALMHVYPRWYKTLPWKSMVYLYRSFQRRVQFKWMDQVFGSDKSKIRMARVYIDKSDGKKRPLGVPSPSGRIYLHMGAALLAWRYDEKLNDSQHGFRPGRGTATAWAEIIAKVLPASNIYEYDLVKFFDRVSIVNISTVLEGLGCPPSIVAYLEDVSRYSYPTLQDVDETDESAAHYRAANDGLEAGFHSEQGVPQGAPTSPFLASLALENSLFALGNGCVQYADDGIFYGDKINLDLQDYRFVDRSTKYDTGGPNSQEWFDSLGLEGSPSDYGIELHEGGEFSTTRKENPDLYGVHEDFDRFKGIELHPTKSGGVKKDGVGLKPLRFLGLVYDGQRDELYSDTKTGKRLFFDKGNLLEELRREDLGDPISLSGEKQLRKRQSFESMVKSRFWGFILDRLYNGSGNQDQLWQNFHLIANSGSGVRRAARHRYNAGVDLFNASSVACRSLLTFLRNIDGVKRQNQWRVRPIPWETPDKPVEAENHEDSAIRWVMRGEGRRAYACPTFDAFENGMVYYVSRMADHSIYTETQMYAHYANMYLEKRLDVLVEDVRDVSFQLHLAKTARDRDGLASSLDTIRFKSSTLREKLTGLQADLDRFELIMGDGTYVALSKRGKMGGRRVKLPI